MRNLERTIERKGGPPAGGSLCCTEYLALYPKFNDKILKPHLLKCHTEILKNVITRVKNFYTQ